MPNSEKQLATPLEISCAHGGELFSAARQLTGLLSLSMPEIVGALSQGQLPPVLRLESGDEKQDYSSSDALADPRLLRLIEQGDQDGMAALYDRYAKTVYWSALCVLRDVPAAEDIVQEVFMMIWRRPEVLSGSYQSFAAWMLTVARNRAYDLLRGQRKRLASPLEDVVLISPCDQELKSQHELMSERASVYISRLPEQMRVVIQMAFLRGMTHMEIAEETGLPLGTVKTKIRNGLLLVRASFSTRQARLPSRFTKRSHQRMN